MNSKLDDFVNVSVRIRPNSSSSCLQVICKQPQVLVVLDRPQTYHFDNIFTEEIGQKTIYDETVQPLVNMVKRGYNSTVFAYGQTGTGKTYTMGTNPNVQSLNDYGLIPRTLEEFFKCDEDTEMSISVSFIEIYNEKVYDLLTNNNSAPLLVKGFKVIGCKQERVFNSYEAKHFLEIGNKNRHTGETKQNSNSSRSHAIFTIYCNVKNKNSETNAKLNLVDLAGCESVKKTGTQGSSFHEGVNINKGLLCIGQVMTALSSNSSFIPYRQSVITTILFDSLNKQNYVSLIACVSSNSQDVIETVQTLEFAYRVKKMKNKPIVNEIVSQYKKDHPALFSNSRMTTPFKRQNSTPSTTTQSIKRFRPMRPFNTIPEPMVNSTAIENSPLFSMNMSSISSDTGHQTFSPTIKKYVSQMEVSLMNKLETVIRNNLRRSTRLSCKENNKENTPGISWNNIQSEISKMVKTEIAQFSVKTARATSSPIENNEHSGNLKKIRKVLTYDSPYRNEEIQEETITKNYDISPKDNFKMPSSPIRKNKSKPVNLRRSTRRMSKFVDISPIGDLSKDIDSSFSSTISLHNVSRTNIRRSTRLALKNESILEESICRNRKTKIKSCCDESFLEANKNGKTINKNVPNKQCVPKKLKSQTNILMNKLKNTGKDSPVTTHTKSVLHILNKGELKQLERLHSVGTKTAEQILLYRQIKGQFKKIGDLTQMPGWQGKKYERFLTQNFLRMED